MFCLSYSYSWLCHYFVGGVLRAVCGKNSRNCKDRRGFGRKVGGKGHKLYDKGHLFESLIAKFLSIELFQSC